MKKLTKQIKNSIEKNANEIYTKMVEQEDYPNTPLVPLAGAFEDERGKIQNILLTNVQGVAIITSKKGTVRSNHWHRTDWHFLFVLEGQMEYYERPIEGEFTGKPLIVKKGEMVFTPPCVIHKTVFTKDTTLLSCSRRKRSHALHEEDVVREEF
jgi:quercetin dioxygenase-like cupin family protein